MAVEVPKIKRFLEEGRMEGKKVGCAICRRRVIRGSINIKE